MVRRLTHISKCEGLIPTRYSYFRHFEKLYIFLIMILFLVYFNFDE